MNQAIMQQLQQLLGNNNPDGKLGATGNLASHAQKTRNKRLDRRARLGSRINTRNRAQADPTRAMNALSKLTQKMTPDQLQDLQHGMGNILGTDMSSLGGRQAGIDAFNSMPGQGLSGSQNNASANIQSLLANLGFAGPGGYTGTPNSVPGLTPQPGVMPLPGNPQPGIPTGPMPGGPGVMGQPSMPGGMQPPIRVNNPGTFFGGQQPQQPLNPGTMQGPMGMAPAMGQQPAAPMNNPQYGGMGIR
tara:strand:+ start:434 stop:1171 length:738 start_codon:yes stop_codon:yes gene_type:complete